jgi:Na+-driven multidrug efflux pump
LSRRGEILKVGTPAALSILIFWAVNLLVLVLIGRLGRDTIAAYGIATRLDTIQYPIIFAFGSTIVTMVATAIGAGDHRRATRVALAGCAVAAVVASVFTSIGLSGASWMDLFTTDPAIREIGTLYLHFQAPVFPLFAAGVAAGMACFGMGWNRLPVMVSAGRLVTGVGGGWIAFPYFHQASPVFLALAIGSALCGIVMIAALIRHFASFGPGRSSGEFGSKNIMKEKGMRAPS